MTTKNPQLRFYCPKCDKRFLSSVYWKLGKGVMRTYCHYCGKIVFKKPEIKVTNCKDCNALLVSNRKRRLCKRCYMRAYRKRQNAGKN